MSAEMILVVEDEPAVARGLQYGLEVEGFKVTVAETGREALDMARNIKPDLIILDIRLPEISGFDVCRQLRAEGMVQPIIMLTARDEQIDKVLGLELGADDYVVKPYDLRELIARVRALLRRAVGEFSQPGSGSRIKFGEVVINYDLLEVTKNGDPILLTPTELRILHQLTSNPHRPISRDALIEAVWGYSSSVGSDRTIDVHIRHLRKKLEEDPANPRHIQTVRGTGYKFEP